MKPPFPTHEHAALLRPHLGNVALGASQFPERLFATCQDEHGHRFRVYGDTLPEIHKKAKHGNAQSNYKVYDAILRSRIK
jgi:hypothetical protein